MFIAHLQALAHKRLDALHKVFLAHSPSLNTPFEDVYPEIVNEFAVTRLGMTPEKLQSRYEEWQKVRFQQSKAEFQALLKESSFVDFWGRMKNKGMASQGGDLNQDSDDEDDDDETGGKANLEVMAKQIDLKEMHDVLQVSRRAYTVFALGLSKLILVLSFATARHAVSRVRPRSRGARGLAQSKLDIRPDPDITCARADFPDIDRNIWPGSTMLWQTCIYRPLTRHDVNAYTRWRKVYTDNNT